MRRLHWVVKAINPSAPKPGEPYVGETEMEISAVSIEEAILAFQRSPFRDLVIYSITTRKPKREDLR
ncbi:MAG TPA: hypothetical protein VGM54_10090 [Chthoniobacter sp.]|jgi:hypothetical protein